MLGRDNAEYQHEQNILIDGIIKIMLQNQSTVLSVSQLAWEKGFNFNILNKKPVHVGEVTTFNVTNSKTFYHNFVKTAIQYPNIKFTFPVVLDDMKYDSDIPDNVYFVLYLDKQVEKINIAAYLSNFKDKICKIIIKHDLSTYELWDLRDIQNICGDIEIDINFDVSASDAIIEELSEQYFLLLKAIENTDIKLYNNTLLAEHTIGIDYANKFMIKSPFFPDKDFIAFGTFNNGDIFDNLVAYNPEIALSLYGTNHIVATPGCDVCKYSDICPKQDYIYRYNTTKDIYLPNPYKCDVIKKAMDKLTYERGCVADGE